MRRLFSFCLCLLLGLAALTQAAAPASGTLLVTVHDSNRMPRSAIRLTLQPVGRTTTTNRNGAASFTALPPGSYTISLAPPSYFPLSLPVTLAANASSGIDFLLSPNGTVEIIMHDATGRHEIVSVPPVPRPVNPPTEYLLTPPVPAGSGPAWRATQEDTLRKAVFRYLFTLSPSTKHLPVYHLSVGGFPWEHGAEASQYPDPAFLKRFQGSHPSIQAVSALPTSSKDWNNPVKHGWIIFRVSSIKWASDAEVEIACGSAQSGYISSDSLYLDCALRHGRWQIIGAVEVSV